jgi:hypothetical protein
MQVRCAPPLTALHGGYVDTNAAWFNFKDEGTETHSQDATAAAARSSLKESQIVHAFSLAFHLTRTTKAVETVLRATYGRNSHNIQLKAP